MATSRHGTVLLADDHALVAAGLARLIEDRYRLLGVAEDGLEMMESVRRLVPDICVVDIEMPRVSGLEAVRRLCVEGVATRFVVLTMHADPVIASRCLSGGALGFVVKFAAADELVTAIEAAFQGRRYVTPRIGRVDADVTDAEPSFDSRVLTPRQVEVVRLLASGLRVKQIAGQLGISPRTVESYKYEAMAALGSSSAPELVLEATRRGLIGL